MIYLVCSELSEKSSKEAFIKKCKKMTCFPQFFKRKQVIMD